MYTYSSQYEVFSPWREVIGEKATRQRSSLGDGVSLLWGVFDWMEWEGLGEVRFFACFGLAVSRLFCIWGWVVMHTCWTKVTYVVSLGTWMV